MQPDLTNPGLWIVASMATAVLATNAAWLARRLGRGRRANAAGREWLTVLVWLMGALFYALPPILAWRSGALSPYLMGLGEVDWTSTLTSGLFLALLAMGVLFAAWILGARRPHAADAAPARRRDAAWLAPLDAALLGWHWAFYRAGMVGWLLAQGETLLSAPVSDPFYRGCWLGLGLMALEFGLNPFGRAALRDPGRQPYLLLRMALAIACTAVFAATRNLWLALLVQMSIETAAAIWPPLIRSLSGRAELSAR